MKKYIFLVSIFLLFTSITKAQVLAYNFTATSGTYTPITGTTIHGPNVDEAISGDIPIGFLFYYNCQPYATVRVSSNGWLSFNPLTSAYLTNALATTVGNIIAPLWDDLKTDNSSGLVRYTTQGTAPNRVFIVEWLNMRWNWNASAAGISFQVRLYETSNRIEFIYRQEAGALNNPTASIGINGGVAGDFYSLQDVSGSPVVSKITENTNLNAKPATDQIYQWDPIICSGMPSGGTAIITPPTYTSCNPTVKLDAFGYSIGCGLTYQWQYSSDGSIWSNIPGATTVPYTLPNAQDGYYRLIVTCTNSSLSANSTIAQLQPANYLNYSFTATSGTYTPITGTTIHGPNVDEAISGDIPIGFLFYYNCQPYATVRVSSNGWLSFNPLTSAHLTNALATTVGNIIAPLWDDLKTSSSGQVRYTLSGTAPNRVFTVEWHQMLWNYNATTWGISFQVRLYETTNIIEFIYNRNGNATQYLNSASASIGINGSYQGDFYSLQDVSANPVVSKTTENTGLNSKPATGQIYRWTPVQCSGTPSTATISASTTTLTCPKSPVTLSATNLATGCGIRYQWEFSVDNVNWSAVTLCNGLSPITVYPENSPTYYRLRTICTNSGQSSFSNVITITITGSNPVNDDPCNATVLPVNSFCSYITSSNICATASEIFQPGIPAPGCANYLGGDVWFRVTVPASGRLIIDMDPAGGPTDMGMAIYRSTTNNCNNINQLIECDDDDSPNGSMPMICRTGVQCNVPGDCQQNPTLTPGETIYVRVWEYGNDVMGPFEICAYDPGPPPPNSTCANATVISSIPFSSSGLSTCCAQNTYNSSVGCLSSYQNGEDFLFRYTPSVNQVVDIILTGTLSYTGIFVFDRCPDQPGVVCVAQATSGSGNPQLCGVSLTAGTTYYIMVDTWPSPNCTPFNITITNSFAPTCNLNYTISSITHNSDPYAGNLISLPVDDRFTSSYVPIGFPFCFDGIQYTQLLVGSNGFVIFDPIGCATNLPSGNATPNGYCPWSITDAFPNTTNGPRNAIHFPWQDIDPSKGGEIRYQVLGTAPNRRFVLSFIDIPYYGSSCTSQRFTGQLKLFETTNNVEIHINRKDVCTAWNSGAAVMGLHNYNGTLARVPAGYNYPTQWTATNQAWRFTYNCSQCIVLPVELLTFYGFKLKPSENKLLWETASETNTDQFIIERMNEQGEFVAIGTVKAAGYSNQLLEYTFTDFNAPAEPAFYRLKMLDMDGSFRYSKAIRVGDQQNQQFSIKCWPNPAKEKIYLAFEEPIVDASIFLISPAGVEFVLSSNITVEEKQMLTYDINHLAAGSYILQIRTPQNPSVFTQKIVIEH